MLLSRAELAKVKVAAPGEWYTPEMKAWLGGYEPHLADDAIRVRAPYLKSLASSKARDEANRAGKGWGVGTIDGLGKNTISGDARAIQSITISGVKQEITKARKAA